MQLEVKLAIPNLRNREYSLPLSRASSLKGMASALDGKMEFDGHTNLN